MLHRVSVSMETSCQLPGRSVVPRKTATAERVKQIRPLDCLTVKKWQMARPLHLPTHFLKPALPKKFPSYLIPGLEVYSDGYLRFDGNSAGYRGDVSPVNNGFLRGLG